MTTPFPETMDFAGYNAPSRIECDIHDLVVEGSLPAEIRGLWYRAGPDPQDPQHAAREIERAVSRLGLRGVIINSHTHDEYLNDAKFWAIFEAAEALDVPVYLHPNTPSRGLIYPFLKPLQRPVSEYLRDNVYVTTSGMPWAPAIRYCQEVLGADHVLYAMDYPYQFVAEEVIASDQVVMTPEDRLKFFQTNAERLFKL